MTSFNLKLIAIVTMVIDHIGFFLFPEVLVFRIIGRLSFLLFAYLISQGAIHTKNINIYLKRLFLFGVFSQIPFALAMSTVDTSTPELNVLFTLFLGLLCIKIYDTKTSNFLKYLLIVFIATLAQTIGTDYGMVGVLSIFFFYIFRGNFKLVLTSQLFVYTFVWFSLLISENVSLSTFHKIQPIALISLAFVYFYNNKSGPKLQHLFYLIYPIQFLVFYYLKSL